MRRIVLLVAILASAVLAAATSIGAAATASRSAYSCTIFFGREYGIVFSGTNRRLLRKGCLIFANGAGKPIQWGIHSRTGWTWVAQYVQPKLTMVAQSIAPRRLKKIVFLLTNRPIFTSRGWVLVRRH